LRRARRSLYLTFEESQENVSLLERVEVLVEIIIARQIDSFAS